MTRFAISIGSLAVFLAAGCGPSGDSTGPGLPPKPNPPIVSVESLSVAAAPTSIGIAKFICPKVANKLACRILGSPPKLEELSIFFDVNLTVENPNDVPLPAVEALVAFTAYPDAKAAANVGAVCFAVCDEGMRCAPPKDDACTQADNGLRSLGDYGAAAADLLAWVEPEGAEVDRGRVIGPREVTTITVRLEVGADALIALLMNVALDMLDSLTSGSVPSFVIPVSVEGTLWVEIEAFGKISAGFGPVTDSWALE